MINILYIPQFSMNDGKRFFLTKDGNFIVLQTMIKYLNIYGSFEKTHIRLRIMIPSSTTIDTFDQFINRLNFVANEYVEIQAFSMDCPLSPIDNRYDFVIDKFREHINKYPTDMIWNHIPELTRNIRAALGPITIPIVSFHHFPDYIHENVLVTNWANGNYFSYFWRQLDGYISSNYNVFNCDESEIGWHESIDSVIKPEAQKELLKGTKSIYLSYTDLDEYIQDGPTDKFEIPTAVFGSRITSSLYTNWLKVISLFKDDTTHGRVIMTNPSGNKGIRVAEENITDFELWPVKLLLLGNNEAVTCRVSPNDKIWIVVGDMPREKYLKICSLSHYAINLYTNERYGGIAIREMITTGDLFPIVPNIYSFKRWFDSTNETFYHLLQESFSHIDELTPKRYNALVKYYETDVHWLINRNLYRETYNNRYSSFSFMMEDLQKNAF